MTTRTRSNKGNRSLRAFQLQRFNLVEENNYLTPSTADRIDVGVVLSEEKDSLTGRDIPWKDKLIDGLPFVEVFRQPRKIPPIQVDDSSLLLYDIFLIINLTVSISFWVTHRLDFSYITPAFSEGCLISIFWVISGLYHGIFLQSAIDGHYSSTDERGGPKAAAALALNTYVNAVNLRLLFALVCAIAQHRHVGSGIGEELLPSEIGFGLLLMTSWRALHSSITPRI